MQLNDLERFHDLENFVVVNEVWNLALSVHSLTTLSHGSSHSSGSTGEHTNLAHVAVLFLDELEEGWHVRTTEMIDGFKPSKHTSPTQPLEVVFTNIQHCCS